MKKYEIHLRALQNGGFVSLINNEAFADQDLSFISLLAIDPLTGLDDGGTACG